MAKNTDFQRAPDAPSLPTGTIRFILYCLAGFKGWIILMLLMETGQAAGSILVPYAIKAIMDAVAQGEGTPLLENLRGPLLLLAGLNLAEILFSRAERCNIDYYGASFTPIYDKSVIRLFAISCASLF